MVERRTEMLCFYPIGERVQFLKHSSDEFGKVGVFAHEADPEFGVMIVAHNKPRVTSWEELGKIPSLALVSRSGKICAHSEVFLPGLSAEISVSEPQAATFLADYETIFMDGGSGSWWLHSVCVNDRGIMLQYGEKAFMALDLSTTDRRELCIRVPGYEYEIEPGKQGYETGKLVSIERVPSGKLASYIIRARDIEGETFVSKWYGVMSVDFDESTAKVECFYPIKSAKVIFQERYANADKDTLGKVFYRY